MAPLTMVRRREPRRPLTGARVPVRVLGLIIMVMVKSRPTMNCLSALILPPSGPKKKPDSTFSEHSITRLFLAHLVPRARILVLPFSEN